MEVPQDVSLAAAPWSCISTSHLVLHGDQQFRRPRKAQRSTEGSLTPNLGGAGAVAARDMLKTGQSTSQQIQKLHEINRLAPWKTWILNHGALGTVTPFKYSQCWYSIYVKFLGVDFLKQKLGGSFLTSQAESFPTSIPHFVGSVLLMTFGEVLLKRTSILCSVLHWYVS